MPLVLRNMLPLPSLITMLHNRKKRICYASVKKRNNLASVKNHYDYASLWKEA